MTPTATIMFVTFIHVLRGSYRRRTVISVPFVRVPQDPLSPSVFLSLSVCLSLSLSLSPLSVETAGVGVAGWLVLSPVA